MPAFSLTRPLRVTTNAVLVASGDIADTGPSLATGFTLSGPETVATGVAATYTVTPNGVMGATVIVTNAASNGGSVVPTSLTFALGSTSAQQFTVTRATDGTSSVSITNNGGLSNFGTPISLTSTSSNAVADFNSRVTTSNAFHAQNWASFANAAAAHSFYNVGSMIGNMANKTPSMGATFDNAFEIITTPSHVLSGKALRLWHGKNNYGAPGTIDNQFWCIPCNGDGTNIAGAYKTKLYFQCCFWVDSYVDYYWRLGSGATGGSKFFIIDHYNGTANTGELVFTDGDNQQFGRAYRITTSGGSAGIERALSTPINSSNFARQNAINRGTALTDENSYQRRYGPMYQGMTGGTSQASRLSTQGVPDPDAAIGGVAINRGGIHVVEVELDLAADRCRVWQAHHGNAPVLTHDTVLDNNNGGLGRFGSRVQPSPGAIPGTGWSAVTLSNLIFTATGAQNPGYPNDAYVDYSELIFAPSPINFPGGQALPGLTYLELEAAQTAVGQWRTINMGGLTTALLDSGGNTLLDWCGPGTYDHRNGFIRFWGKGHLTIDKFLSYSLLTNQWSVTTSDLTGITSFGHPFYHGTMDRSVGDYYLRDFNSNSIRKWTRSTATWGTIASKQVGGGQIAGGLAWSQALNSGIGGLAFADLNSIQTCNLATNTWTMRQQPLGTTLGNYHNWACGTTSYVYFGGGNGSSTVYRIGNTGAPTLMTNSPLQCGINGDSIMLSHPSGEQLMLFSRSVNGPFYKFDGSAWSSSLGAHQMGGSAGRWVGFTLHELGCILFISQGSPSATPVATLYRPA